MWTLARSVAAIENRLPDAVTVEAAFKRPVLLPGTVAFGSPTVLFEDRPAARMGDPTDHGGVITLGIPTVLIGP
jgi:uncharacterized Zn-binding protein involved in type VI secretion